MKNTDVILRNAWDGVTFYCMNHDEPVEMVVKEGHSMFYACPRHMLADPEHPDGHSPSEPSCPNNLSFVEAQKIVEHISNIQVESTMKGIRWDFTNYEFTLPGTGTHVTVLHYEQGKKHFGVLNRRAFL